MDDRLRETEIELGRVKQRVEDHEGDFHRFAALPTELEKVRWAYEQQTRSLDALHTAHRELAADLEIRKREIKVAREEIHAAREERQAQIEATREEAQAQIKAIEIARLAHEKEQQALNIELRNRDDQRRAENRRNLYVLAGVFLAAAGQVINGLIGGGPP